MPFLIGKMRTHCDSMKYDLMLHWITLKYAVSRMKMPYVRESASSLICSFQLGIFYNLGGLQAEFILETQVNKTTLACPTSTFYQTRSWKQLVIKTILGCWKTHCTCVLSMNSASKCFDMHIQLKPPQFECGCKCILSSNPKWNDIIGLQCVSPNPVQKQTHLFPHTHTPTYCTYPTSAPTHTHSLKCVIHNLVHTSHHKHIHTHTPTPTPTTTQNTLYLPNISSTTHSSDHRWVDVVGFQCVRHNPEDKMKETGQSTQYSLF